MFPITEQYIVYNNTIIHNDITTWAKEDCAKEKGAMQGSTNYQAKQLHNTSTKG